MIDQAEVRESHELPGAAWSLYARASRCGEVVDMEGVRVANAKRRRLRHLRCLCGSG